MSSVDKAFRARERRQKALGSNDFLFFFCDDDDMLEPSITIAAFACFDFDDDDGFFFFPFTLMPSARSLAASFSRANERC
jgi:hypothetical protein